MADLVPGSLLNWYFLILVSGFHLQIPKTPSWLLILGLLYPKVVWESAQCRYIYSLLVSEALVSLFIMGSWRICAC
ncbi:hypothetical protein Peur_007168 [Populus x canadensis]